MTEMDENHNNEQQFLDNSCLSNEIESCFELMESSQESQLFFKHEPLVLSAALECKRSTSPKMETCKLCYKRVSYLKKHMLVHSKEKPFKCEECDHCCSQKSNLNRHINSKHSNKYVRCPECGVNFKRNDKLKDHMTKFHNWSF
ncbi:zinc finger protein 263-like [Frankliniella occidentalis]|uniref:Zinc finger protein 263-like n=1 Tax=Frankliniella occidentalis TaxID=133901 RepID=A0A6J1SKR1_FRAOC|nr:zinc finger protein 263-like [Frankliniella occidentalis]